MLEKQREHRTTTISQIQSISDSALTALEVKQTQLSDAIHLQQKDAQLTIRDAAHQARRSTLKQATTIRDKALGSLEAQIAAHPTLSTTTADLQQLADEVAMLKRRDPDISASLQAQVDDMLTNLDAATTTAPAYTAEIQQLTADVA